MRRTLAAALCLLAAAPGAAAAHHPDPARSQPQQAVLPDVDGDCHDDVPEQIDTTAPDQRPRLPLRVLLAVDDGITAARAQDLARRVRDLYAPTRIDAAVRVRRVPVDGTDVRDLIDQARTRLGGQRPRGFDVVHLITPVDVTSQGDDSSIGLADCIGGIRDPRRAFSVSEISPKVRALTLGPVTGSGDEEARSIAHEIGHLLGARHEHANCTQGAPAARPTDSPCTIMFLAAPSSDVFGAVEAAVARGYLTRYGHR